MALGALHEIVFQTSNPAALARFWQAMIGGDVDVDGDEWASLENDETYFVFVYSPDRPTGRSGIRLTVDTDDIASTVESAEDLGAAKQGDLIVDEDGTAQPMIDPGGFAFTVTTQSS